MKKIDLTDQTFGHLTVLQEAPKELRTSKNKVCWYCKCDCGNEVIVSTDKLRSGQQQSCGHQCIYYKQNFIKDLTGQRFGKLIVLKDSGKRNNFKSVIWKCQCDCGNICEYESHTLQIGRALSCGCLKESYGEYRIALLLQQNNIPYLREKTFDTCKFQDTQRLARFDFYVDDKYLIEFDGKQHFVAENYKWNTTEKLRKTQEHDVFKNQWCKNNNIPLIRIPYTIMQQIKIEDLLLDTTQYREI